MHGEIYIDKHIDEKEKKVAAKPIPDNHYKRFKYRLEESNEELAKRNLTLLSLGVATGYRLQDIVCLTIGHIREALIEGEFVIQESKQYESWKTYMQKYPNSKRNPPKKRKVAIGKNLEIILEEYVKGKKKSEYAFRSSKGKGHITSKSFSRVLSNIGKDIGIKNISGHSLRKTYARRLYDKYGDIERVRQRLGHGSIETTKRYLGIYDDEGREDANVVDGLL